MSQVENDNVINKVHKKESAQENGEDEPELKSHSTEGQNSGTHVTDKTSDTEREKDVNKELEEEKVDLSCGIWKFRTNTFGTCFANLYVFATFVGLSALFSEMIRSVIHVQLTSIEKQFNIDNSKAGLLDVVTRAGYLSTILFGGHFAKKAHIPIVIGLSGIFQAFLLSTPAFLQFALPYELPVLTPSVHSNITNTTSFGDNAKYMCDFNVTNSTTKQRTENLEPTHQVAFVVLLVMQTIKGVSDTFHASFLPVLYMDDNILDKGKMGIFLGIQHVITDLASPIGKEINGLMTEIPIDLKKTQLDPKDGRFVAAWWLAFLVFGIGLGIASFPLLLFPRKLISKSKQKEALDKAVVSYVGGQVLDEIVEKESDDKVEEIELEVSDRKESIKSETVNMPPRKYSINVVPSRKSSVASVYQSSSRRPSMFPPLVPPTERKVSIAGDLVFEQPIKVHAPVKTKKEEFKEMLIDFPKAIFRLLRNPAYDLLLLDIVIMSVPFSGLSLFRSVYTANEYNVPMSTVTLTSGISTALGHIVGTGISSYLTSKVNTRMGYVYIIMSSYILTCAITPLYIIFGCDNQMVHGAKGDFGIPVNTSSLCDCTNSKVLISCGDDGHNYLNPCVAGCQDVDGKSGLFSNGFEPWRSIKITLGSTLLFENVLCYVSTFTDCRLLTNSSLGTNVNPGLCDSDCYTNFIIYTFLSGLQSVVIPMAMIPRRLLVLRIVDPRDRGFATSMFMFFFSFMAIPSPNLFGKVIDGTCLVWDGRFCALYDRDKIRYFLSGLDVGVYGLVLITFFVMFILFKWEERKLKRLQQRHSVEESVTIGQH